MSSSKSVIWCDAAPNTAKVVVNRFGKKMKVDYGGYRVAVVLENPDQAVQHESRQYVNRRCPDQFAGECFAVLKAIEFAVGHGLKSITIRNDRIEGFEESVKRGYAGAKYLFVAKKISEEGGVEVSFDRCSSRENLADSLSRMPPQFTEEESLGT